MAAVTDFRRLPGELRDNTWWFPTVTSVNSHNKKITWRIFARLIDSAGMFVEIKDSYFDRGQIPHLRGWRNVDSGVDGGKVRETVPTIVTSGKNLGKKNETNVWTQVLRDSLGIFNKQLKKATGKEGDDIGGPKLLPPMLSQVFSEHPIEPTDKSPIYVQRKYNGVRAVAVKHGNDVVMYSRRRTLFLGLSNIKKELADILPVGVYLDGEVYKHGVALQDISGAARRETSDIMLDYIVYDCFEEGNLGATYDARKALLDELFARRSTTYIKLAPTQVVRSRAELDILYSRFLQEGFEGAMVRTNDAYKFSYNEHHSRHLLKMKPVQDAEMEIVDWDTGKKGKAAGALMIICATPTGTQFPVTPAMEISERIALAAKMAAREGDRSHFENHWKGKKIIIEYDELSKDGVPLRARTRMRVRTWD